MAKTKQELYDELSAAVIDMDEELSAALSAEAVEAGLDAFETIDQGLAKGMEQAGQLFDEGEYFVPELLMCADALNAGVDILEPHIKTEERAQAHKIVIGVIQGDTHDIGKNLVKLMLSSSGFDVIDLGRDVPPDVFVERAIAQGAKIIMISSLMTTTMDGMTEVVRLLTQKGVRDEIKVAVGGGPVSQGFANKIGADGYSYNANQAVKLANELVGR
ncbi:MAG: corrinoid protein [Clostridiales bacterium]|nr:corrinoid protein [Clostridiales bacterium]